jgi:hypothetical protein
VAEERDAIPEFVRALFWDTDPATLDLRRHARYIICRVLDYGDHAALNWLRRAFGDDAVRRVVESGAPLHPKTLSFWRRYFDIADDATAEFRAADKPHV